MPTKKDGVFISLKSEERAALDGYLTRHGLKKSTLLRAILRQLLNEEGTLLPQSVSFDKKAPRKRAFRIFLSEEECEVLKERMDAEGWDSEKEFFYACLRWSLFKVCMMPSKEVYTALKLVSQIRRIGMNLNQIARALNDHPSTANHLKAENIQFVAQETFKAVEVLSAIIYNSHHRFTWEDERVEAEWAKKLFVKRGTIPFQNLDELRW